MLIKTTEALADFCAAAERHPYITVDTEFLRERTYFSQLCLIQVGYPGLEVDEIALIDVLEPGLSMDPLLALFKNPDVIKVFHAARQDLEIFWHDYGVFPEPFFDTQIAAMVCGFGDQVGYETLVKRVAKATMDKSSRFTDWSQRPLTEKQLFYAANDVTHLRDIYEKFCDRIQRAGRMEWVKEEMAAMVEPSLYDVSPGNAWRRVRTRNARGRTLAAVIKLAEFREEIAQKRNIPRGRVFKDEALMELAANRPMSISDLSKSRLLTKEARGGAVADGIIASVKASLEIPPSELPEVVQTRNDTQAYEAVADLLRVLLKAVVEREQVASKLIASAADLDAIAQGERDVPALKGWRRKIFGETALKICSGTTGLVVEQGKVKEFDISA
ncbi:MAG: ribonuclease D [Pseudomonadota bacterium]